MIGVFYILIYKKGFSDFEIEKAGLVKKQKRVCMIDFVEE